jgi:penicillin-binding protein 1C
MAAPIWDGFMWRPRVKRVCSAGLFVLAALLLLDWFFPPDLTHLRQVSRVVEAADGTLLRAATTGDGVWRLPITAEELSAGAISAQHRALLLAFEDKRFGLHPGIDPLALTRAAGQWMAHGRIISGGSTISMQVARLLVPRARTLSAKAIEIVRALQLQARLGTDGTLAAYLTLAPYGGNIEGVRAAALSYFGKSADALTLGEAALLVALPQSPERLRPDRFPQAARAARDKVLDRGVAAGVLTATQAAEAKAQPVPTRRLPLPFIAPHLSETLLAAHPDQLRITTTLDARLQVTVERIAAEYLSRLEPKANIAVLVLDAHDRRVLAHLGSAAYFDAARSGQIDLTRAVRSPGSALKPFIYGLALDDGTLHPGTLISDRPTRFGSYAPSNFSQGHAGDVTVREALQRSLNIPAVAALDRVGPARLVARLSEAGARLRLSGDPGLALALGGAGITLAELTDLYAALADGGRAVAAYTMLDETVSPPVALLSPLATWYVTDMLAGAPPPQAVADPIFTPTKTRIAYKTGTSYGFRDAWAVGYTADFVVGVWVGRPDGTPSPGRYGREAAAPLLWRVFDILPAPRRDVVPPPPPGMIADNAVPAALARLRPQQVRSLLRTGDPAPRVAFPVDGSALALAADESMHLAAAGGTRPLTWLVDGLPVGRSTLRRTFDWQPSGPGQVRITVLDARGRADSVEVWLEP